MSDDEILLAKIRNVQAAVKDLRDREREASEYLVELWAEYRELTGGATTAPEE